jgi:hypothetical protein
MMMGGAMLTHSSRLCVVLLLLFLPGLLSASGGSDTRPTQVGKNTLNNSSAFFLINNVVNAYSNTGVGSTIPNYGNAGFEFPKGSGVGILYTDGIMWEGKQHDSIKAGGTYFSRSSLQPGRILVPGTIASSPIPSDPLASANRIYRVRPDICPSIPFSDVKAKLHDEEVVVIHPSGSANELQLYDQYIADWKEWPAGEGAPFTDRNGNGTYEWDVDIPGKPGADQTLWCVANDLDSSRTKALTGSAPMGIEFHRTIWGYRDAGSMDNVIFLSTMLINKSAAVIDSMFIGQWEDPDLGEAHSDNIGCDTVRQMGYVYNSTDWDDYYGTAVPAGGAVVLQGPRVTSAGDSAWFRGARHAGFKNIRMYAFPFVTKAYWTEGEPSIGPTGATQWYRGMHGRHFFDGGEYVDPVTGLTTTMCVTGDPLTGVGWIDGPTSRPNLVGIDRRLFFSLGPFTMAPGDTQEIVMAHVGALGTDRFSSLSLLRSYADLLHEFFDGSFRGFPPGVTSSVAYQTADSVALAIHANCRRHAPTSVTAQLIARNGSQVTGVTLFDDGNHGDGPSGDGIFANTVSVFRQPEPLSVNVTITESLGSPLTFEKAAQGIITAGEMSITGPVIYSDNGNNDGRASNNEEVRFGVNIVNRTPYFMSQLRIVSQTKSLPMIDLASGAGYQIPYNLSDPQTYFNAILFYPWTRDIVRIPVTLLDGTGNSWSDSLTFVRAPLLFTPHKDTLVHVAGKATGNFEALVLDPSQFRGHQYAVEGAPRLPTGEHAFTLRDLTDGHVLLSSFPMPDSLGHSIPVTEGFRLSRGSTVRSNGRMTSWAWRSATSRNWSESYTATGLGLEGFSMTIGNAFEHWPSGGVGFDEQHSVRIVFAETDPGGRLTGIADTAASFAYRYMQNADKPSAKPAFAPFLLHPDSGYAYQGFAKSVPFAAYDIDVTPPRRLAIGHLENNVTSGLVDGLYFPPLDTGYSGSNYVNNGLATGPREWFFIFDLPYGESPDPSLQVDILHRHVPLMWVGYPSRLASRISGGYRGFQAGEYTFNTNHAPEADDRWTITLKRDDYLPASTSLSQNYPNPFNPSTTIDYSLALPSNVSMVVYDILGQRVRTLVDEIKYAGEFSIRWDGTNDAGKHVASGVYLCRLGATSLTQGSSTIYEIKKMLLLH